MKAEFSAVNLDRLRRSGTGISIAKKKLRLRLRGILAVSAVHTGTESTIGQELH